MDDVLTFAKLKEVMARFDDVPPVPFFGKSRLLSDDHALQFKVGKQEYVLAGRGFWDDFQMRSTESRDYRLDQDLRGTSSPSYGGIEIVDLDLRSNAHWCAEAFSALIEAMRGT